MINYFITHYFNLKNKLVFLFFIILQLILTISFLNLSENKLVLDLHSENFNLEFQQKIIFITKIMAIFFTAIIIYNHDSICNIPLIIKVGRNKYYFIKILFFLIIITFAYILNFLMTIITASVLTSYFKINLLFIKNYFLGLIDSLIFLFFILTVMRNDNKSFIFGIAVLESMLLLIYKTYNKFLSFYNYLIPLSESNIYTNNLSYIYITLYFILFYLVYFLKTRFEQIKVNI